MKRALLIALILVFMAGTVTSDAWAGAEVYFTVTVGVGLVIGVVGVFVNVAFVQRVAEQRKLGERRLAASEPLLLNTQGPSQDSVVGTYGRTSLLNQADLAGPQIPDRNLYPERFNLIGENRREVHPDLEVNFLTFRW